MYRALGIITLALFLIDCDTGSEPPTGGSPRSSSPATSLLVMAPNGGETFKQGSPLAIRVSRKPPEQIFIVFELSIDDATSWHMLSEDGQVPFTAADTIFSFELPDSVFFSEYDPETASMIIEAQSTISDRCRIRARDYDQGETVYDISDEAFSIAAQ